MIIETTESGENRSSEANRVAKLRNQASRFIKA